MNRLTLAAMVGVVGLAAAAWGQDRPLSGPPVKEERPAGLGGQFAEGKGDRKGPMTERVPMRLYVEAIAKLRAEDAPADLKLSGEQNLKVTQIEAEFRNTMREVQRRAREEGGPLGHQGTEMTPQDRERMQQQLRKAIDPADVQVRIYSVLTPAQKKFVEAEVATGQAQIEKRRMEEYAQRQIQKKKGEAGGAPAGVPAAAPAAAPGGGPGAGPGGGPPEGRERLRRLMERLSQLSPQEREQLLTRLEQELDRRGIGDGPQRGGKRPGQGGEGKPAPKIDEVKVPAPDKL